MKVEILIVSYLKDKPWLIHCLNSIRKFAKGFSGVTLAVPLQEVEQFADLEKSYPEVRQTCYDRVDDRRKWHIDHQRFKCWTDKTCPTADVVFHIDSDTFFTDTITPADTCPGGKPMLIIGSYAEIEKAGVHMPWKPVVDFVMGGDNKYETIRMPHPCYWLGTYRDVREHIEKRHNMDFDKFVLAQRPDFPWGFTENNMLGTMALTPKWRDKYHIVNVDTDGWPTIHVAHFWSHSPPDKPQDGFGGHVDPRLKRPDGTVIPNEVYAHYGI